MLKKNKIKKIKEKRWWKKGAWNEAVPVWLDVSSPVETRQQWRHCSRKDLSHCCYSHFRSVEILWLSVSPVEVVSFLI